MVRSSVSTAKKPQVKVCYSSGSDDKDKSRRPLGMITSKRLHASSNTHSHSIAANFESLVITVKTIRRDLLSSRPVAKDFKVVEQTIALMQGTRRKETQVLNPMLRVGYAFSRERNADRKRKSIEAGTAIQTRGAKSDLKRIRDFVYDNEENVPPLKRHPLRSLTWSSKVAL
jgi:hypothetical protein